MTQKQNQAMNQAIDLLINNDTDISTLFKEDGLLKQLTKRLVEKALQSEMNNHLGYSKYSQSDIENSRNGYNVKNLMTKNGAVEIEVPRDRNSSFEPALIAKRQRRFDGFDDKGLCPNKCVNSKTGIKFDPQILSKSEPWPLPNFG